MAYCFLFEAKKKKKKQPSSTHRHHLTVEDNCCENPPGFSSCQLCFLKMQSWKHTHKQQLCFPQVDLEPPALVDSHPPRGVDPAAAQTRGHFLVGEKMTSPRLTHGLHHRSAPLPAASPAQLPLHAPHKPLPCITPQVKSSIKMGSVSFSGSCCLGRVGSGVQSYRGRLTLARALSVPPPMGGLIPSCKFSGGEEVAGPWAQDLLDWCTLGSLRLPLLPYFPSGWSCSFLGLGKGVEGHCWG